MLSSVSPRWCCSILRMLQRNLRRGSHPIFKYRSFQWIGCPELFVLVIIKPMQIHQCNLIIIDSSQAAFQTANVSSRITISVSRSNSNSASILRSSHLRWGRALVSLFPYHYWSANQHTSACPQPKRLLLRMEAQQSYYSPMPKTATTWNRVATTWNCFRWQNWGGLNHWNWGHVLLHD